MVVSKEKRAIQKFVKWLKRNDLVICDIKTSNIESLIKISNSFKTEEEALKLVERFWSET